MQLVTQIKQESELVQPPSVCRHQNGAKSGTTTSPISKKLQHLMSILMIICGLTAIFSQMSAASELDQVTGAKIRVEFDDVTKSNDNISSEWFTQDTGSSLGAKSKTKTQQTHWHQGASGDVKDKNEPQHRADCPEKAGCSQAGNESAPRLEQHAAGSRWRHHNASRNGTRSRGRNALQAVLRPQSLAPLTPPIATSGPDDAQPSGEQRTTTDRDAQLRRLRARRNAYENLIQSSGLSTIDAQLGVDVSTSSSSSSLDIGEQTQMHQQQQQKPLKCRVEKDLYLDIEQYRHYTCASCYNTVPSQSFKAKLRYNRTTFENRMWLFDTQLQRKIMPNETQLIRPTFRDESIFEKWQACCRQAVECCEQNARYLHINTQSKQSNDNDNDNDDDDLNQMIDAKQRDECPATWDGLTCWPNSPAGQLIYRDCPKHVYFLTFEPACTGTVTKQCFPNASWYIRNDHEWSDYSHCNVLSIYVRRMLISAAWHIFSVALMAPALVTISKFSNRGGNKRVKILRNLILWLLVNSCIQAAQKSAIVTGLFEADRSRADEMPPPPPQLGQSSPSPLLNSSQSQDAAQRQQQQQQQSLKVEDNPEKRLARGAYDDVDAEFVNRSLNRYARDIASLNQQHMTQDGQTPNGSNEHSKRASIDRSSSQVESAFSTYRGANKDTNKQQSRCKRNAPGDGSTGQVRNRRQKSPVIVFFCWFLVVASRIVRLMCYSWMFTGAIYLCSALHFAPAEPPAQFIRILMFLTNAFPILIAAIYVTSRTIVEPSPLNIIFKVPYYKLLGDEKNVTYLWDTQLECWFDQSKYDSIEEIADLPNLILVCLNVGLFIITLIILCRINRPGSTRPDMSPFTYFKAAGTLVVLYGGHYALLAYRPNAEGCLYDSLMFYAFLFVDGIQGIAVSYVFCYRTQEGKEIIGKYFRTRHLDVPFKWFNKFGCCHSSGHLRTTNGENGQLRANSRSIHSTRSNNSACNGQETVTELINIHDTPVGSNRF